MLNRAALLALMGVLLPMMVAVSPAAADGTVVCNETLGGCVIVAEDGGSTGTGGSPGTSGETESSEAEDEPACDTEGEVVTCSVTVPGAGASPAQVAAQAIEQLPLPLPQIGLAPAPDTTALVGLPVWLWVQGQTWSEVSRTASAGSISVTATATPDRVEWDMGDGSSVTCYTAGRPYTSGGTSSCTHTYERASQSGPYPITATVYWDISWSGGGASGGQTLTRSSESALAVGESQAIVQ
jgi:hypothetical protein